MSLPKNIILTTSPDWKDYQLLDSGDGKTLERFGNILLVRPRPQAGQQACLPANGRKPMRFWSRRSRSMAASGRS